MEERKQNVLIVHNYYQIPGGEDTVVANEKKMLEDHGHKVVLYSRNNSEIKEMSKFQKLKLPFTTIFNPRTYAEIKKIIKKEKIDIVHVHNTLNLISPAVYYAALSCKVQVVQTIHNFRLLCPGATFYRDGHICEDCVQHGLKCAVKHGCYRESKAQTLICVVSMILHRMTGIYGKINYICLTEFNKRKIIELKQIKEGKVFVKPNFIDCREEFVPEEARNNQFVFAGRLDKLKGIDILLKAWKQMGEKAPRLIVCGTGPMEKWCKDFSEENKINAEFRGFVSNAEVLKVVAHSKALILPTQWYEGFPMSIVEAFSVGTPVICSGLGNAGSVIEERYTGYKFEYNSPEALTCVIEKVTTESQDTLSQNAYRKYREYFNQDRNYEMMREIYDEIIREGANFRIISVDFSRNADSHWTRKQVAA